MSGKNTAPKGAEKDQENSVDKIDVTGLAPEVQAYISSLESKVEEHAACVEEIELLKQTVSVLEQSNEELELEAVSLREKAANSTIKKCDGVYKAENGNTYQFKQGFLKVSVLGKGIVTAEKAIKDASIMERLISIKYGGLEIVKS